jgi:hypothetical protein
MVKVIWEEPKKLLKKEFKNLKDFVTFATGQDLLIDKIKPASFFDAVKKFFNMNYKAIAEAPVNGWTALLEVEND